MRVKQLTPMSAIENHLEQQLAIREKIIIRNFCYVGELCQANARDNGSYTDRTGNLRGSVGYCVVNNGVIVQSGAGINADGQAFLRQLAAKNSIGIVLIVVAGKRYAKFVSAKGFNVLDSAEFLAEKLVPQMLKKLNI